MPDISPLPTLNAILNLIAAVFLVLGRGAILRGNVALHRRHMLAALGFSAAFLASYLYYHYLVGSVKYEGAGWLRALYLIILIPHIILATLQVPFIFAALWTGLKNKLVWHVRIVKIIWPVWMYVSVTGVLVYLMLYIFPHGN